MLPENGGWKEIQDAQKKKNHRVSVCENARDRERERESEYRSHVITYRVISLTWTIVAGGAGRVYCKHASISVYNNVY